jgi:hypothetical protein
VIELGHRKNEYIFSPETKCPCSLPSHEIGESWNPQTVIFAQFGTDDACNALVSSNDLGSEIKRFNVSCFSISEKNVAGPLFKPKTITEVHPISQLCFEME